MTRREFEYSIVGELKVLWLDPDEVRGIIRRAFAFLDNKFMYDFLTVGKMRAMQKALKNGKDVDPVELQRLEIEVDKIVDSQLRRYNATSGPRKDRTAKRKALKKTSEK